MLRLGTPRWALEHPGMLRHGRDSPPCAVARAPSNLALVL